MVHGQCIRRRLTPEEESEFLLTQDEANNFVHINSKILLTPTELLGKKMDMIRRRLIHDTASDEFPCTQGRYADHTSGCSCEACQIGQYQVLDQHTEEVCDSCGSGEYQDGTGQFECKSCIATCGSGTRFSACTTTTDRTCPRCGVGAYQDSVSHSDASCKSCTATCGIGTKYIACSTRTTDRTCPICATGTTFQDSTSHSSTSCKSCVICTSPSTEITACTLTTDTVCGCAATQVPNSNKADTGSITGTLNVK